jgi:hypothetical protein
LGRILGVQDVFRSTLRGQMHRNRPGSIIFISMACGGKGVLSHCILKAFYFEIII